MRVPTRHTMMGAAALAAIVVLAGVAWAGGGNGNGCNTCQPAPIPVPTYKGTSGSPCCGGGGQSVIVPSVNVAGPNVTIGGTNVNVTGGNFSFSGETYLNVTAGAQASSEASVIVSGGGGGFSSAAPVATSAVDALNVVGGEETYTETVTEEMPVVEEYCVDEVSYRTVTRSIQAVCIDDTGAPHPASQVHGEKAIAADYSGEVYRCMAGTHMQVALGSAEEGGANFDHGQTLTCQKGEALVYKPGGQLSCQPQIPQRNCNERSLLRRHGPGIKVFQTKMADKRCVPQQRTVMKTVTRNVEKTRVTPAQSMVFDGGVGQGVY